MTENVIRKVANLLKLAARAGTPEEAAAAAARAQDIMERHAITQTAAEAYDGTAPEAIGHFDADAALEVQDGRSLAYWRYRLASTLAKHYACYCYQGSAPGGKATIAIVGRPSDVEGVRYLFAYLVREIEGLADRHGRGKGRIWRNNFRTGVIDTVGKRLKQQHANTITAMRAEATIDPIAADRALVKLDTALEAREALADEVAAYVKRTLRLRTTGSGRGGQYDLSARQAGQHAGRSISLGSRGGLGAGHRRIGSGDQS